MKNHMSLNRQIIKQKEEEVKARLESANQPKSKLKHFAVYFEQMKGKFRQNTKTCSQSFKDHQQQQEGNLKKRPKLLHLVTLQHRS